MAHLLGSKYCIESLRNDVTDLQGAVIDVFSRAGPVQFPSWKYPDQISSNIDMTELLERYDYSEDEEERQVSHIVLMELVIDRLVLLLQAMAKFTDQLLSSVKGGPTPQGTSNTSIGLVVKKYWNRLVQLSSHIQNINTETKKKSRMIQDMEETMSRMLKSGDCQDNLAHVTIPLNNADASRLLSGTLSSASNCFISRDECIKSTQTVETAFVPCESCDLVQKSYRETGDNIVNICTTQDLPSTLAKHRSKLESLTWMCGSDVMRWSSEQNKDLARINKYLSQLHGTIEPLQNDLEKEQKTNKQLQNRLAECAKEVLLEKETQSIQQKQYEKKMKDLEQKSRDDQAKVNRKNQDLEKGKKMMEDQVEKMKEEFNKQQQMLTELEKAKQEILNDMEAKMTDNEHFHKLEGELSSTRQDLKHVQTQLENVTQELNEEKIGNKNATSHTESLHGKQEALKQQMDLLNQERMKLQNIIEGLEAHVDNLKEENEDLQKNIKDEKALVNMLTTQKQKLELQTEELQTDIHKLQQKLQKADEHQKMLTMYPDINGPVNPDVTGTGDLVKDMENQISANGLRISVLEQQNTKLQNAISKVLSSHGQNKGKGLPPKPVPLWKVEESRGRPLEDLRGRLNGHSSRSAVSHVSEEEFHWETSHLNVRRHSSSPESVSSRPPKPAKDQPAARQSFVISHPRPKSRPKSGKKPAYLSKVMENTSHSSIGTYTQLKKSGLIKAGNPRPPSAQRSVASRAEQCEYLPAETFSCHKCDKMYSTEDDLELHQSYCYGGR